MAGPGGPGVTTLVLPLQWGAQVQSVVGELRSHRLQSGQKKKKKEEKKQSPNKSPLGPAPSMIASGKRDLLGASLVAQW